MCKRPEKALHGGDLRVCNDEVSAGAVTVMVRPNGMVYLAPGSCFNEWGSMLTFKNDGSGAVIVRYRSISKNNGRCPASTASIDAEPRRRLDRRQVGGERYLQHLQIAASLQRVGDAAW